MLSFLGSWVPHGSALLASSFFLGSSLSVAAAPAGRWGAGPARRFHPAPKPSVRSTRSVVSAPTVSAAAASRVLAWARCSGPMSSQ